MRWIVSFVLVLILSAPAFAAQVMEGKVVGVSDGDTITVLTKAPVCREWKHEEDAARLRKAGLWADASPVPPWEYRKAGRSGSKVKSAQPAPSSRNDAVVAGGYSGNTNSGIFHASGCRYFSCKNCTAHFSSRDAAISAGYRPCKVCRP